MSGRYRLLQTDYDAITAHGAKIGDRDALQAQRLGIPYDDFPGMEFAEREAFAEAHRLGLDVEALSIDEKVRLISKFVDGYRPAYAEAWPDQEEH